MVRIHKFFNVIYLVFVLRKRYLTQYVISLLVADQYGSFPAKECAAESHTGSFKAC